MTFGEVFDPIFLAPFVNGLLLAVVLPSLGAYSRLRGEWLGALGIGQAAAAGMAFGGLLGLPMAAGALLAAVVGASLKTLLGRTDGDDLYAVMLLAGWSVALLLAANTPHGEDLSRAFLEGQIYFTGTPHLAGISVLALAAAGLLPWLSPRLLLGRFFPDHFAANGAANPAHEILFDLLTAIAVAVSASVVGVMGAFALVFVPPWVAFHAARGWRRTVIGSAAIGAGSYVLSFALAMLLDQPFGPVLVSTLILLSGMRAAMTAQSRG